MTRFTHKVTNLSEIHKWEIRCQNGHLFLHRPALWIFVAMMLVCALVTIGSSGSVPASIASPQQIDPLNCDIILQKAAKTLGWSEDSYELSQGDMHACLLQYYGEKETITLLLEYEIYDVESECYFEGCEDPTVCENIDFHGNNALNMPGRGFSYCESTCNYYFAVGADNLPIDFSQVGEAVYAAAQEVGCGLTPPPDTFSNNPPEEVVPDSEGILPPLEVNPGNDDQIPSDNGSDRPGGSPVSTGTSPVPPFLIFVSFSVPILGGLIGGIIAAIQNLKPPSNNITSSKPIPQPLKPDGLRRIKNEMDPYTYDRGHRDEEDSPHKKFWRQWENATQDIPLEQEEIVIPDTIHQQMNRMDPTQAKEAILRMYGKNMTKGWLDRVDPKQIKFLDKDAFQAEYESTGQTETGVLGFAKEANLEAIINRDAYTDFSVPHEELHLLMGPDFRKETTGNLIEAATEYLNCNLAIANNGKNYSGYTIDGRVKVMEDLAILLGDGVKPDDEQIRKAFFGRSEIDVIRLSNSVDEKLRPGSFKFLRDLMQEGKYLKARALIRGVNIDLLGTKP